MGIFEIMMYEMERKEAKQRGDLITAAKLGLRSGDLIIWKDGTVDYVESLRDELRYKNIAEVKRPIKWKEVEIKLPKRTRRNKKEDK